MNPDHSKTHPPAQFRHDNGSLPGEVAHPPTHGHLGTSVVKSLPVAESAVEHAASQEDAKDSSSTHVALPRMNHQQSRSSAFLETPVMDFDPKGNMERIRLGQRERGYSLIERDICECKDDEFSNGGLDNSIVRDSQQLIPPNTTKALLIPPASFVKQRHSSLPSIKMSSLTTQVEEHEKTVTKFHKGGVGNYTTSQHASFPQAATAQHVPTTSTRKKRHLSLPISLPLIQISSPTEIDHPPVGNPPVRHDQYQPFLAPARPSQHESAITIMASEAPARHHSADSQPHATDLTQQDHHAINHPQHGPHAPTSNIITRTHGHEGVKHDPATDFNPHPTSHHNQNA